MEKLDKVIAGLECCGNDDSCLSCPYKDVGEPTDLDCIKALSGDALDLLKEQNRKLSILRTELAEERERSARWVRESEPVVHAHWMYKEDEPGWFPNVVYCSACKCGDSMVRAPYCRYCGAHMDEQLELRTCYCPICDKHFQVRSNDSGGSCPDCGHHVVLHEVEVTDD